MLIPENLYYKLLDKKCILFMGAGATKESGGVLAKELGEFIYNEINCPDIKFNDKLERYTQALVDKGYRADIEKIVRARFKSLNPSEKLKRLSSIPWKAIYTTNYDDLIEKSFSSDNTLECIVEDLKKPRYNISENEIPLYKIHGSINNTSEKLVITLADIKENIKLKKDLINQLTNHMYDCIIFVGYSLNDGIITPILDQFLNTSEWDSIKEKYIVTPDLDEDANQDLSIYRIKHIKCTAEDFFDSIHERIDNDLRAKYKMLKLSLSQQPGFKNLSLRTVQKVDSCFEYYKPSTTYPFDTQFYYKGGKADWGMASHEADVNRELKDENTKIGYNTFEFHNFLSDLIYEKNLKKILIAGPAVSGKTTTLYRIAYELTKIGIPALFYKNQAEYKSGLLANVFYECDEPFVVIIDDLNLNYGSAYVMYSEAQKHNLPIVFVLSTRYSDWENHVGEYSKQKLLPFDYSFQISDDISKSESKKLIDKLVQAKLIQVANAAEKDGIVNKLSKSKNLIEILVEVIDRSNLTKSISMEYDILSPEAKESYGLVSLFYRYDYLLNWNVLRRALDQKFSMTWVEFYEKILNSEARGNLFEEERHGSYYLRGRHRYISKFILDIHYAGNFSEHIAGMRLLIDGLNEDYYEERVMGSLMHKLIVSDFDMYEDNQILELFDYAINKFKHKKNISYVMHLKGEYYIKLREYNKAIICFDSNIQNGLNVEFSLNSLGKAYYYLAQTKDKSTAEFRTLMNNSIKKLMEGIETYNKNEIYYSIILSVFDYLRENKLMSEQDVKTEKKVHDFIIKYMGGQKLEELKEKYMSNSIEVPEE